MREKLKKWNFSVAQFLTLFLISLYITLLCEIISDCLERKITIA